MKHAISSILILFSLLISTTGFSQAKSDWVQMELKGKVKTLEERSVNTASSTNAKNNSIKKYYFNERGNIVKIDESNQLVVINYDASGNRTQETIFEKNYGQKGRLIAKRTYKNNLLTTFESFDKNGEVTSKAERIYTKGFLVKETVYYNGEIYGHTEYKNDARGNQIELKKFDRNQKLILKNTFAYNDKNQKVEFSIYDWNTNKIQETYKYQYNVKGEQSLTTRYNEKNIPVKTYKRTYQYTYDPKGNWTYFVTSVNGKKQRKARQRKIEYYP